MAAANSAAAWLGKLLELAMLTSRVTKAAKRFFEVTEFHVGALADGLGFRTRGLEAAVRDAIASRLLSPSSQCNSQHAGKDHESPNSRTPRDSRLSLSGGSSFRESAPRARSALDFLHEGRDRKRLGGPPMTGSRATVGDSMVKRVADKDGLDKRAEKSEIVFVGARPIVCAAV
jgi:hypothetical protein